uniref:30S ribosomal protein S24e n=1 Tax=uncultured korarchaeote TaxID=161241 RepID=A0A1L2JK96_9CREN|nr:ribosomal protein S24E [uncultured korarchaeote]
MELVKSERQDLLHRTQYIILLKNAESPLKRIDAKRMIVGHLKADPSKTLIGKMRYIPGTRDIEVKARVYDSLEYAKRIEPKHIIKRNITAEQEGE